MYQPTEEELEAIKGWLSRKLICPQQRQFSECRGQKVPKHPACRAIEKELQKDWHLYCHCPCEAFGFMLCESWAKKVVKRCRRS